MEFRYRVRFVHKIAPRPGEYHDKTADFLNQRCTESCLVIAAVLRDIGVLAKGARIRGLRREVNPVTGLSQIVVFAPHNSVWHALVLEPFQC